MKWSKKIDFMDDDTIDRENYVFNLILRGKLPISKEIMEHNYKQNFTKSELYQFSLKRRNI